MKWEQAVNNLFEFKSVRRKCWAEDIFVKLDSNCFVIGVSQGEEEYWVPHIHDFLNDDWEVIE